MVESHANSTDDYLIDGLSFQLPKGASYVTNRRSFSFSPSGSDTYGPTSGTKVIKIRLNGTDWLDPSTVKIMFTFKNTDATNDLKFLSGPHAFFRRMCIVCGGQIVEDIDDYNRVCEMFNILQSKNVRANDEIEGTGRWDGENSEILGSGGATRRIGMKSCSGLLNQSKMLPLRYCPIEIELELVNAAIDAVGDSTSWLISDVQCKCDLLTLDNGLENSYAAHVLEGKSLPINYSTYVSQSQVVPDMNINVHISRAVTRLKSIFMSMYGPNPTAATAANLKEFNNFWHPNTVGGGLYNSGKEVELQIQVGSKLYPEYPIRSSAEAFSQLRKTMGIHQSPFHSLDLTGKQYRDYKFIVAIDTEKVLEAGFTGLNTRAGDMMTIKAKAIDSGGMGITVADKPTKFFTVLHSDCVIEIRENGISISD